MRQGRSHRWEVELARLEGAVEAARVAATREDRLPLAEAVFRLAVFADEHLGAEAALPRYEEVLELLDGQTDAPAVALRVVTGNNAAICAVNAGLEAAGRALIDPLVERHLDNAPLEVGDAMANLAFLLVDLLEPEGRHTEALGLLDRARRRYGQPPAPSAQRTRMLADQRRAEILVQLRRPDDAMDAYRAVVEDWRSGAAPPLREIAASSMMVLGALLKQAGRTEEALACAREIQDAFQMEDEQPNVVLARRWADAQIATSGTRRLWRR